MSVSKGHVQFNDLHDMDNATPLCPVCHNAFDRRQPYVIMLPTDLDWFLEFEKRDFSAREQLLKEGRGRRRAAPAGDVLGRTRGKGRPVCSNLQKSGTVVPPP